MRKMLLIVFAMTLLFCETGCKKAADDVIDCFGESLLVSIKAEADQSNSKLINFTASYLGSNTVTTVIWDYGDGKTETVSGTTANHTYNSSGNFTIKAKINIVHNKNTCTPEPTKNISVQ